MGKRATDLDVQRRRQHPANNGPGRINHNDGKDCSKSDFHEEPRNRAELHIRVKDFNGQRVCSIRWHGPAVGETGSGIAYLRPGTRNHGQTTTCSDVSEAPPNFAGLLQGKNELHNVANLDRVTAFDRLVFFFLAVDLDHEFGGHLLDEFFFGIRLAFVPLYFFATSL